MKRGEQVTTQIRTYKATWRYRHDTPAVKDREIIVRAYDIHEACFQIGAEHSLDQTGDDVFITAIEPHAFTPECSVCGNNFLGGPCPH